MVEDVEDAGFGALGALTGPSPVAIADGSLTETPHAGLGIRFAPSPVVNGAPDPHFVTGEPVA